MPSFTIIAIKKALFWKPREKNLYRQVQFAKTRARYGGGKEGQLAPLKFSFACAPCFDVLSRDEDRI